MKSLSQSAHVSSKLLDKAFKLVIKIVSNPFVFIDGLSRGFGLFATLFFANQAGLEEFGRFSFLLGVAAFLRPIGSLELHRIFEKQLSGSEAHFLNYLFSCLLVFLTCFSLAVSISVLLNYFSIQEGIVLLVTMQLLFAIGTREIITGFLRVFDSQICYLLCELCFNLIPLVGVLIFFATATPMDFIDFANFYLIGSIFAILTVTIFVFLKKNKMTWELYFPSFRKLLPFILDAYKSGMFQSIDKIILAQVVGFEDLGIWALCQKIASPIRVLPQSILRGMRRELVTKFHAQGSWDRALLSSFFVQSIFLITAYTLPACLLIFYFFTSGVTALMLLITLSATMIVRVWLLQLDMMVATKGQSKWLFVDTIIGVICLPPILYLLVSFVGIIGVALTQLIMVSLSVLILSKEDVKRVI